MIKHVLAALFFGVAITAIGVVGWQWYLQNPGYVTPIWQDTSIADLLPQLAQVREVITPAPLRGTFDGQAGLLTVDGILEQTNVHRATEKLAPLTGSATLNQAAANKIDDMFAQQYFEHISPDGRGPSDVVDGVQYHYIRVGENLALGNFASDAALVQAWMDSPGHRANIMNGGFEELGIAARRGQFEGRSTWLAVQTFAKPLSSCPGVDTSLQATFAQQEAALAATQEELSTREQEITQEQNALEALAAEINQLIAEGNAEIKRGNEIAEETGDNEQAQPHWDKGKSLHEEARAKQEQLTARSQSLTSQIATYNDRVTTQKQTNNDLKKLSNTVNQQIRAFNACLEK